jgi:hypothetical protein
VKQLATPGRRLAPGRLGKPPEWSNCPQTARARPRRSTALHARTVRPGTRREQTAADRVGFVGSGPPVRVIGSGRGTPVDMDLLGDRLALTRRYQGHGEVEDSALDLIDIRSGRRRLIDHLNGGGQTGHFIVGASRLPHGALAWAQICGGDPEGCVSGTELVSRWTPRGGPHSHELLGVEAFAATPFARWALQGCDPATYPDSGPCVLSRFAP